MSDTISYFQSVVGKQESPELEYKTVLPPSRSVAQLIAGFANTQGGVLLLGVANTPQGIEIRGLSEDFHANAITHRALDLLTPQPEIEYHYFVHQGKKLYGIRVKPSALPVKLEGKLYYRQGEQTLEKDTPPLTFKGYAAIKTYSDELSIISQTGTNSKHRLIDHYQSVLKIIDDLGIILYPDSADTVTTDKEGKLLCRILFASFVDNFETYLSDLLFEIFLAKPQTLKSKQMVTVEEVLNCSDIQDFVRYWAQQKLHKLQKGSIQGFISENQQIKDLNILDAALITKIDQILQVRHLYIHRAGIVDEKFMKHFPTSTINTAYELPVKEICLELMFLARIADQLDKGAIGKYDLAEI